VITLDECTSFIFGAADSSAHGTEVEAARLAAISSVQRHCGRTFTKATTATARTFVPESYTNCWVDDFHTTTDLVVKTDDDDDGTFEVTWTATDYVLHPLDGLLMGETRPYCRIEAVESRWFPCRNARPNVVQVTAQWGWATLPDAVRYATLIQTHADFTRRTSPHGVAAFGEFGPVRVRGTLDPRAAELLMPYRHPKVAFGVA